jgi:hypothetical protein
MHPVASEMLVQLYGRLCVGCSVAMARLPGTVCRVPASLCFSTKSVKYMADNEITEGV